MVEDQVIHGERGKMIALTLLALMFAILNFMLRDALIAEGGVRALVGYAGYYFWLACAGIGLFRAIYPPILTLREDGFTVDWRFGAPKTIAWSQIDSFYLRKMSALTKMVGYVFHQPEQIKGAFQVGGRADGWLPDHWTVPVDELVDLLQSRLEASRK